MTNPWGPLLGVWAHPDDETYLAAAHMMRAVAAGDRVVCVTATRGELGSPDERRWPSGETLAAVRTAELEDALAALGVREHHWLDHPDGGCADVSPEVGAAQILQQLQEVRPATVLTFGPDGVTGHPDHRAVSRWVDAAVAAYDGPRPTVLWATDSAEWWQRWGPVIAPTGAYLGNEPVTLPRAEMRSAVTLTPDELERKVKALRSQESQTSGLIELLGGLDEFRLGVSEECYR